MRFEAFQPSVMWKHVQFDPGQHMIERLVRPVTLRSELQAEHAAGALATQSCLQGGDGSAFFVRCCPRSAGMHLNAAKHTKAAIDTERSMHHKAGLAFFVH